MTVEGRQAEHLSDEDLILALYCGELGHSHLSRCLKCQGRTAELRSNREKVERDELAAWDVSPHRLAAQRRKIYEQLSRPEPFWLKPWTLSLGIMRLARRRWIPAGATILALGGGLLVFQYRQHEGQPDDKISDVALAQEVSRLSQNAEAPPTEPLKALFE